VGRTLVTLDEVWRMLRECAPGFATRQTDHYHRVMYEGRTYPSVPLGHHGARKPGQTEIETGHVRKLARFLGIEASARRVLPSIYA
jgi:hypothetical protein